MWKCVRACGGRGRGANKLDLTATRALLHGPFLHCLLGINNGRNSVVMIECDPTVDEPVFYPTAEDKDKGPQYTLKVRSMAGCPKKQG